MEMGYIFAKRIMLVAFKMIRVNTTVALIRKKISSTGALKQKAKISKYLCYNDNSVRDVSV